MAELEAAREANQHKVEYLRALVQRWLDVMTAAGYPEAEIVTVRTHTRVRRVRVGPGPTRILEPKNPHTEEYAGWCVATHAWLSNPRDDRWSTWSLFLLIDGRLIADPSRSRKPTEVFSTIDEYGGWASTIAESLTAVAARAGVEWDGGRPPDDLPEARARLER